MMIVMKVTTGGHRGSVVVVGSLVVVVDSWVVAVGSLVARVVEASVAGRLIFAEGHHSGHDRLSVAAEVNFSLCLLLLVQL